MKKTVLMAIIALLIYINQTKAQQAPSEQLLFKDREHRSYGLYVSPELQYGQVKNRFTPFGGASIMFLFNQKFAIGFTYHETMNNNFSPKEINPLALCSNFAGLKTEYILNPNKAVHITFPLVLGIGTQYVFDPKKNIWAGLGIGANVADFNDYYVIQPGLQVEANLVRNIKFYIGGSYRFAGNLEDTKITKTAPLMMQGALFSIGTKIGVFNFQPSKIKFPNL